jgi:hypothetical protein
MALSLPNEDTVEANELILHGPSTLKGHVEYRAGTRLALLLLGASIEIVGGILLYQGLSSTHDVCIGVPNVATGFATVQVCHPESSPDTALIAAGALTLAVGLTVGFVRFFGYRDKATIEVIPLTSLLSGLKGVAIEGSRSTVAPEGVGVRVKF